MTSTPSRLFLFDPSLSGAEAFGLGLGGDWLAVPLDPRRKGLEQLQALLSGLPPLLAIQLLLRPAKRGVPFGRDLLEAGDSGRLRSLGEALGSGLAPGGRLTLLAQDADGTSELDPLRTAMSSLSGLDVGLQVLADAPTPASEEVRLVDRNAPLVLSFSPSEGATGVATTSNIVLSFNEAIQRGSGTIQIRAGSSGGTVLESFDAATSTRLLISGSQLTIDPSKTLSANTRYFVVVPAGSLRDVDGNGYAGTSSYNFQTVDTRAPLVSTFSPADGSSSVAVGSNIVLSFNEAIQRGNGLIEIRSGSSTGPVRESFNAASSSRLLLNGSQLTIDPSQNLAGGTRYFVTFAAGSIRDMAGNSYAGTTRYDFSTAPADTSAPLLSSATPSAGATGVALNSAITLRFNESIQRGSGTLELRLGSSVGSVVESFAAATSPALSVSGVELTITPTAPLDPNSRYVLVIPSGAIKDLAGNNYAGSNSYDFSTIDTLSPQLTSINPADGSTGFSPFGDIALTFNEAIQRGSGSLELRSGSLAGPVVESFDAATSTRLLISGSQLLINPSSDLSPNTSYVLTLPAGSVRDLAGNSFTGLPQSGFTTSSGFNPTANPLYSQQWHLSNTGQGNGKVGVDVRAENAWAQTSDAGLVLGGRTTIAIVDDGLQRTHPDLAANYLAAGSYDFNYNDSDPSPSSADSHGTACAGVAAAVGTNSIGVSGIAPKARLSGIRLIAAGTTDSQEGQALGYAPTHNDIYSNSWGPNDSGTSLAAIGPLAKAALANGFSNGRGGKGALYFWAGGNGRQYNDNSNYDGYANSKYVIAVGAIANTGVVASYSEPGANLLVSAPSSGGTRGIVTTDLTGSSGYNGLTDTNYTNSFGGTSSATPLAAGVAALVLDAVPTLSARDVMHILAQSATKVNPTDAGWKANGAGLLFHHDFGFGMVNAGAAVSLAKTWTPVAPLAPVSSAAETINLAIPDNGGGSLVRSLTIQDNLKIEAVEVLLNASHTYRGDLEVRLTSPSGSTSILASKRSDANADYSSWIFSSRQHWDEQSQGTWTLTVTDRAADDVGTLHNWGLTITGTPVTSTAPPSAPSSGLIAPQDAPSATAIAPFGVGDATSGKVGSGNPKAGASSHRRWAAIDPQLVAGNPDLHAYLASLNAAISQGRASLQGVDWTVASYAGAAADPLTGLASQAEDLPDPAGFAAAADASGRGPGGGALRRQQLRFATGQDPERVLAGLEAGLGSSLAYYYPNLALQQTSRTALPGGFDPSLTGLSWSVPSDPLA